MTILTSRRRFLAGLFCAPAIIPAAKLMAVKAWIETPAPIIIGIYYGGNEYESYTTWFRYSRPLIHLDWKYAARIANIEPLRVSQEVRHGALVAASQVRPLDPEPRPLGFRRET